MIAFLIGLAIAAAIIYCLYLVLEMIKIPKPFKRIVYIVIGIIVLFWVLDYFGIYDSNILNIPTRL